MSVYKPLCVMKTLILWHLFRQLLSSASNTDALCMFTKLAFEIMSIILDRVEILLEIINPGPHSPNWAAVACDNWRLDLTTQKISSCRAFNSFIFDMDFFFNCYVLSLSMFCILIKPLDSVKAGRFSCIKCKYFPSSTSC